MTERQPGEQPNQKLLGFWPCLALVVGTLIGSGIYLLPAQLAPYGWNALVGWLLTIGGTLCIASIFAHLSRALPGAAGPYAFVDRAFGRLPAFAIAWSYWISVWVGNAAIAVAAASYLSLFFPVLAEEPSAGAAAACAIVWLLTGLNCVSLRAVGQVQLVTVILKLLPLLLVIAIATAMLVAPAGTAPPPPRLEPLSWDAVNEAAALTLWAMLGIEAAAWASRNVRDPARNVPRATLLGTLLVGLIYLLVSAAIIFLLPAAEVAASGAPIALFVERFLGIGAGLVIGLFAAVSVIGALNGLVLLQGELPLAMARDGAFPAWFAKLTPSGRPVRALILSSLLTTLLIFAYSSRSLSGLFAFMALLSTAAALVLYFTVALTALELQRRNLVETRFAFLAVAGLAILYALWTFHGAGLEATGWALVLIAAGLPVYLWSRWRARVSP
jgi:APA family basic amino acid/polyamine antiporter